MQAMRIMSINRGTAEPIDHGNRHIVTGINKQPVDGAVAVSANGVDADTICDEEHHGGPDQAVYVYCAEAYDWWSKALDRPMPHGKFGDNLTIAGFDDDLNAGDRLLIGDVILEATAPRIPCTTLAVQMQDSNFGLRFRKAERPGVYFRVLNEGELAPGDPVTLVENPAGSISMLEIFRIWFQPQPSLDDMQRIVDAPVAARVRDRFRQKIESAHRQTGQG